MKKELLQCYFKHFSETHFMSNEIQIFLRIEI